MIGNLNQIIKLPSVTNSIKGFSSHDGELEIWW